MIRRSGVRDVIAYNWPRYTAGLAAAPASDALADRLPRRLRTRARAGSAAAFGLLASATVASWLVYDRSELYDYDWLDTLLPQAPSAHVVVGTGLDEASLPLAGRWPASRQITVDLYDPAVMTEGSVRRARRRVPPPPHAVPGRPDALPVRPGLADAVFLVFAAHELRRARDREQLFVECARVLRPGGRAAVSVRSFSSAAGSIVAENPVIAPVARSRSTRRLTAGADSPTRSPISA